MKNSILNGELNPFSTNDVGSNKMQGVVKWFNGEKGFGFISVEGREKDIFVHHSDIEMEGYRTLTEGQQVEFETEEGDKGTKAKHVKLAGNESGNEPV